jgi:hypothetical protein
MKGGQRCEQDGGQEREEALGAHDG